LQQESIMGHLVNYVEKNTENKMIHTKKLTIGLTITLFALITLLLFLVQKDAEAQEQQKAVKLQNELRQPIIEKITLFDGFDETGRPIFNTNQQFKTENKIFVSIQISSISNPTTEEGKYVFGLQEYAEVVDENGNKATPFNGLIVNMDNYLKNKGDPITINNQFETTQTPPGTYYVTITIYDKISKLKTKSEPIKFEII